MTRIRRGYIAQRRRAKIHFFASTLVLAHRDRGSQKRNFHHLWITQINAVIHGKGVSYRDSCLLIVKILAEIAILNRNCLYMISNEIIKEVGCKESTEII
ncbi:hypothetical protein M9H77_16126 [Catharanthus roseus]|uniref:Uncharacterized protein n=1 Tax=Catharanthus roseus TaxID=4058 RepID=A0ACC0B0Z5_CATRO|nr:hypothetical protein M9H77_16126 [Catharanthus roseus]